MIKTAAHTSHLLIVKSDRLQESYFGFASMAFVSTEADDHVHRRRLSYPLTRSKQASTISVILSKDHNLFQ